jgi:hypothetical protein
MRTGKGVSGSLAMELIKLTGKVYILPNDEVSEFIRIAVNGLY